MFADDDKISKILKNSNDKILLQEALNKSVKWSEQWLLGLNVKKCAVLSISKQGQLKNDYYVRLKDSENKLQNVDVIKDLEITMDNKLTFKEHVKEKISKANCMLGIIKEILNT
jgi:hypothetical protein